MAKKKYKVEDVNLRVPCRTELNKAQELMSEQIGFKLTQSQVIQKLLRSYIEENEAKSNYSIPGADEIEEKFSNLLVTQLSQKERTK